MLNIPTDIYGRSLFNWARSLIVDDDCGIADKELLQRLLFRDFQQWDVKSWSDEDKKRIIDLQWDKSPNKEIKARALEILMVDIKDKRDIRKNISNLYLDVFDAISDFDFLLRAVQIRCAIKTICDDSFLLRIENYFPYQHIYNIQLCLEFLVKPYGKNLPIVVSLVNKMMRSAESRNEYREHRACLETLKFLSVLTNDEADYQCALSYEQEADWGEQNKDANTYNMQTHILYGDAYKKIARLKDQYLEEKRRIFEKMKMANADFVHVLSLGGIKIDYSVADTFKDSVDAECQQKEITNVYEALGWLSSIPWPSKESIDRFVEISHEAGPISSMLGTTLIDSDGHVLGKKDAEESLRTDAHRRMRINRIYAISQYLKVIVNNRVDCSENALIDYLFNYRASYLQDTTVLLLAKGLSYAFIGDIVTAVHLLMPSLESMLRQYAEWKHGDLKNYAVEIHEDKTLCGVLNAIKGDLDETEWFEIHSFLESGIDENCRNNLLHGLMHFNTIPKCGIYSCIVIVYFRLKI